MITVALHSPAITACRAERACEGNRAKNNAEKMLKLLDSCELGVKMISAARSPQPAARSPQPAARSPRSGRFFY
jgi:hypothetical protein